MPWKRAVHPVVRTNLPTPYLSKFLALIPARKGSKRLPGKNLRPLLGKPLISYSIRAGLDCPRISETFVSTDSSEILELAAQMGCSKLGLRPDELAADTTSSIDVLQFEVSRLEAAGIDFDFLVLLQPTSPLRNSADIELAIEAFLKASADTLTTGYTTVLPGRDLWLKQGQWLAPAQEVSAPPYFKENGAIYILKKEALKAGVFYGPKTMGSLFPEERSVDIDTLEDFQKAEQYLNQAILRENSSAP